MDLDEEEYCHLVAKVKVDEKPIFLSLLPHENEGVEGVRASAHPLAKPSYPCLFLSPMFSLLCNVVM